MATLFGFEITRKSVKKDQNQVTEPTQKQFSLPDNQDGAVTIQSGAYYGHYVDLDGIVRNEIELITRYREMAIQPELEGAIDDIVNEAIVHDDSGRAVEINLDELDQPESVKEKIRAEFEFMLRLLDFGNMGHDIFRRWYIDGRLFYHIVIDTAQVGKGIQEIRYIDPRRIRKIREIQKKKDTQTGMDIIHKKNEYYLYNERGIIGAHSNLGSKIAVDAIVNVNSGLMDAKRAMVLSYLHKAIKPLNQLRMIEDATVIYRLSRAPERRVFYIDVGNMPTIKAEQYLKDIMTNYRNKLVYDSNTGEIKDDRKHMSMLEDFWLPRREGNKGTEITTLPAGQNLGQMEDVKYFEKKLMKALGVPVSRLEQNQGFSLGRTTEITRDELKFSKFIQRLRSKFSTLFDDIMRVQLSLKKICNIEEWDKFKEDIWYDFKKDNNFNELKEAELMMSRVGILQVIDPFVGRYYSQEWVRKHVLQQTEDEMREINEQIAAEQELMQQQQAQAMANDPNAQLAQQQAQAQGMQAQAAMNAPQAAPVLMSPEGEMLKPVGTPMTPPQSKFETQPNELEYAT